LLKGETRPSRVPAWEPEAERGPVPVPAHLSAEAAEVWHQYAAELEQVGLLRPRNADTFAIWCSAVALWRRAAAGLADAPLVVEGERGAPVTNPLSRDFTRYAEVVRRFGIEFGMTPAAVTAIGRAVAAQQGDRPPERLFT
jgi:P27 family predicted phage terminase small subunit